MLTQILIKYASVYSSGISALSEIVADLNINSNQRSIKTVAGMYWMFRKWFYLFIYIKTWTTLCLFRACSFIWHISWRYCWISLSIYCLPIENWSIQLLDFQNKRSVQNWRYIVLELALVYVILCLYLSVSFIVTTPHMK